MFVLAVKITYFKRHIESQFYRKPVGKSSQEEYEEIYSLSPKVHYHSNSSKEQNSSAKANSKWANNIDNKNPYLKILDQLPQEIKDKLDRSKENLEEMWKTITLPKDWKPYHVLKWIK